jgi:hypothetical protein
MFRVYKVVVELSWEQVVALRHKLPREYVEQVARRVAGEWFTVTHVPTVTNERTYEVSFREKAHLDEFCVLIAYGWM